MASKMEEMPDWGQGYTITTNNGKPVTTYKKLFVLRIAMEKLSIAYKRTQI